MNLRTERRRLRLVPRSLLGRMLLLTLLAVLLAQGLSSLIWLSQLRASQMEGLLTSARSLAQSMAASVSYFRSLPLGYRPLVLDQLRSMGGTRFFVSLNDRPLDMQVLPSTPRKEAVIAAVDEVLRQRLGDGALLRRRARPLGQRMGDAGPVPLAAELLRAQLVGTHPQVPGEGDVGVAEVDAQFGGAGAHARFLAEDGQVGHLALQQPAGGAQDAVVAALGQHDALAVGASALHEAELEHEGRDDVGARRAEGPQICLRDVSGVLNADGPGGYKNPSKDARPYDCTLPSLPAVDLKRG